MIRMYLKDISRIPLLTVEEERALGRRIKSGDLMAQQKLIESNLRLVIKIARKFSRRPDQLMELLIKKKGFARQESSDALGMKLESHLFQEIVRKLRTGENENKYEIRGC